MRKAFSSLLLLTMLLATFVPLLALAPQTLPACCRANGTHHCTAMMNLGGEGFRAQMPACPYRQHPAVTPLQSAIQVSRATFSVRPVSAALGVIQRSSGTSAIRYSLPKRGPPLS
jgi:hypothetical protein